MATIKAYVRKGKKDSVKVRFRIGDGNIELYYSSDIIVEYNQFDNKNQKSSNKMLAGKRNEFDRQIFKLKDVILQAYTNLIKSNDIINSNNLDVYIQKILNPNNRIRKGVAEDSILTSLQEFISYKGREVEAGTKKMYEVVYKILERFILYKQLTSNSKYDITINNIRAEVLYDLDDYIDCEHIYARKYPELLENYKYNTMQEKSSNYKTKLFKVLSVFDNWLYENNKIPHRIFEYFKIQGEVYGEPYYISIEERNKIYNSIYTTESLRQQADIFTFHCLIGCRVSDLHKLTKNSVVNGAIEYIAQKDNKTNKVIRVPLIDLGFEIIEKYKNSDSNKLLPFISDQKYNIAIKEIFTQAGITRNVTIYDSTTNRAKQVSINTIASSHIARRTFIGNLYKKIKDPNLIGSLSGHSVGSKAFARYRSIDDDIKKSVVDLLN